MMHGPEAATFYASQWRLRRYEKVRVICLSLEAVKENWGMGVKCKVVSKKAR
jgi:hypothetical protein